jgi:hypothetical protein
VPKLERFPGRREHLDWKARELHQLNPASMRGMQGMRFKEGHHKSLFNEGDLNITKRSRFNRASSASKTFNDIWIQRHGNTGILMMKFSIANSP